MDCSTERIKAERKGKDVYRLCAQEALMILGLLHEFSYTMQVEESPLLEALMKYRSDQRHQIEVFLKSKQPPNQLYDNFLMHSRLLLYIIQRDGDIILTKSKASVTIMADFSPEFNPQVRWRSKHRTKNDCQYQ